MICSVGGNYHQEDTRLKMPLIYKHRLTRRYKFEKHVVCALPSNDIMMMFVNSPTCWTFIWQRGRRETWEFLIWFVSIAVDWILRAHFLIIVSSFSLPPSMKHRTLLHTSRRNSTRNTTRHGIASLAGTLDRTWRTRRATSSTFIWARSPSCCSRAAKPENETGLCHSVEQGIGGEGVKWKVKRIWARVGRMDELVEAVTWCNTHFVELSYLIHMSAGPWSNLTRTSSRRSELLNHFQFTMDIWKKFGCNNVVWLFSTLTTTTRNIGKNIMFK